MPDSLTNAPGLARAVGNITAGSERQPNAEVLEETCVEAGVLPQVANFGNQILCGSPPPAGRWGGSPQVVLAIIQARFLDIATDPARVGFAMAARRAVDPGSRLAI